MTTAAQPTSVLAYALAAAEAGICVIPPREDGSKMPLVKWEEFQGKAPDVRQLRDWYRHRRSGVGFVCGAVSGNLELFDFDDRWAYQRFKALAESGGLADLVARIEAGYCETTPKNGIHWLYRCTEIAGNTKLARRPKEPDEMEGPGDKVKVLIETRGEGGYVVVAPSNGRVHPSGKPYQLTSGGVDSITTITPDERDALWTLARSLDRMPRQVFKEPVPTAGASASGPRPGDDFNERATWAEILEPHGWTLVFTHGDEVFWKRPGSDNKWSATTNYQGSGLLYVFTTSTAFESERAYSKFAAYAILNHGGDFQGAARELATKGYGDQTPATTFELPPGGIGVPRLKAVPTTEDGDDSFKEEAKQAPADPYPMQTLADLVARRKNVELTWLAENILRRGKTQWVYASPGVGKTLLMLAIGMHVAAGKPFCGLAVEQGGVVYIGEDSPLEGIAEYAEMLADAHEIDLDGLPFHINCERGFRLNSLENLAIACAVVEHYNPVLVVLDSAERIVPSERFNSAEIDFLVRFVAWLTDKNITVVVIDHTNKKFSLLKPADIKQVDMLEALYGGRTKSGIADFGLYMSGSFNDNGIVRVMWTKQRGEKPDPLDFRFNGEDGFFLLPQRKRPRTENERKVLTWFNNGHSSGYYTRPEIQEGAGLKTDRQAERLLASMARYGLLLRRQAGAPHGGTWATYALNTETGAIFDAV